MGLSKKIKDRTAIVCIVGVGYIGLPLAEAFSKHLTVIGYDINENKIQTLTEKNENNKLTFTSNQSDIKNADFVLIAVPTPITKTKEPDLFYITSAAKTIGRNLKKETIVVLESTVYPGVTEDIVIPILENSSKMKCGKDFKIGYSPERINPGDNEHTVDNITKIVSGIDEETVDTLSSLYNLITKTYKAKDIRTAEAAKVIENVQRDINIALMNELALIFGRMNIDIINVIEAASTKWNFNVYKPGAGVGGHCLPVDPYYLVKKAEELDYNPKMITAGRAINDYMPLHIFELLVDALDQCEKTIMNSKIVILGFSYKENVGDPRESHVVALLEELKSKKACIHIIDPHIEDTYLNKFGKSENDVYGALKNADALVLMTAHNEFKKLDTQRIKKIMNTPIIIDGRRIFDQDEVTGIGFTYRGIGAANKF